MSWQSGPIFISPGASVTFNINWPGSPWMGPQYILARPSVGLTNTPLWLETTSRGVMHVFNGSDLWTYTVTVREMFGRNTTGWIEGGKIP